MLVSASDAALCLRRHGATAMTDVTGFGVIGHLAEMAKPAGVDIVLDPAAVPMLDGALDCVRAGIFSSLQPQNLRLRRALTDSSAADDPRTWGLVFLYFVSFGGFLALTAWFPIYWVSLHSFSPKMAGILGGVGFSVLAALVRVYGGVLSERIGGERLAMAAFIILLVGAGLLTAITSFGVNLVGIIITAWLWPLLARSPEWYEKAPLAGVIYHQLGSLLVLLNSMRLLAFERRAVRVSSGRLHSTLQRLDRFVERASNVDEILHGTWHANLGRLPRQVGRAQRRDQ